MSPTNRYRPEWIRCMPSEAMQVLALFLGCVGLPPVEKFSP
jgi:hypothetical protein